MQKLWFKAKTYGWGWTPCSWEGWAVTALAILSILLNARIVERYAETPLDVVLGSVIPIFITAALLIIICIVTGEKPGWRWGNRSDK